MMLADMMRRLRQFGLSPMIALADTLGAAHALAGYGIKAGQSSVIARVGAGRDALADLPVEGLRLDAAAVLLLKRLGLRRIGQLYDLPRQSLERRFCDVPSRPRFRSQSKSRSKSVGRSAPTRAAKTKSAELSRAVLWRLDQALGLIGEPRAPLIEPPCFTVRRDYPDVLISSEALVNEIERLIGELTQQLAAAGNGARRLRLSVYRADGSNCQIVIGTSFPSRDPAHLMRLIKEKIEALDAGFGVDVLVLSAAEVEPLSDVQSNLTAAVPSGLSKPSSACLGPDLVAGTVAMDRTKSCCSGPEGIACLLDTLTNRIGYSRIFSLKLLASHSPERRQTQGPVAAELLSNAGTVDDGRKSKMPALQIRPSLLLSRPEPILVIAPHGDDPPTQFVWRRMTRQIVKAAGPERISAEWWRHFPEAPQDRYEPGIEESRRETANGNLADGPLRDYYDVQDQQGGRYWLFRYWRSGQDCTQSNRSQLPRWYVHGVFA